MFVDINLTKRMYDYHTDNYKILKKERREILKNCEGVSLNGKLNILKMSVFPKLTYKLNVIPQKNLESSL